MILEWLRPLCTRVRGTDGILDGFDSFFYIRFDCAIDTDNPEVSAATCDILIVPLASDDWKADSIRVVSDANRHKVMRFLFALGVERFPDKIKAAMYDRNLVIRAI